MCSDEISYLNVVQVLKEAVLGIRRSSTLIQNTLSNIEGLLCTRDQVKNNTVEVPILNPSTKYPAMVMERTVDTTPRNVVDYTQKRKLFDSYNDGGKYKSAVEVFNVSDNEDSINVVNQAEIFAKLKMESPSVVVKPQLPSSWTQPGEYSSKKKKYYNLVGQSSDVRNTFASPVIVS